jgi:hypothetical protein
VKVASFITALVAWALFTGAAQAASGSDVIRLTSVQVSQKRPNDTTFIIHDNDVINGKKVGHDTLTCKVVAQSKVSCSIAVVLAAGKLNGKFGNHSVRPVARARSLAAPASTRARTAGSRSETTTPRAPAQESS